MGVMVFRFVASDDSGVLLFSTFPFLVSVLLVSLTPNLEHFRFQYVASFLPLWFAYLVIGV